MLVDARWFLASQEIHAAMVSHVSTGSFVVVAGIRDLAVSYRNGFAEIAVEVRVSRMHSSMARETRARHSTNLLPARLRYVRRIVEDFSGEAKRPPTAEAGCSTQPLTQAPKAANPVKGTVRGAYATFGAPRLGRSAWRIHDARSADPLHSPVKNRQGSFCQCVKSGHPLPTNPVAMTTSRLIAIANHCY